MKTHLELYMLANGSLEYSLAFSHNSYSYPLTLLVLYVCQPPACAVRTAYRGTDPTGAGHLPLPLKLILTLTLTLTPTLTLIQVPRAFFSVGRNIIHRNPRRYYQRILQESSTTSVK